MPRSQRLILWIPRHAGLVLALTLGLALLATSLVVDLRSGAVRIAVDPSTDRLLPADDPARILYDRARRLFGGDEPLVVALAVDDVFTSDVLERVVRLTERLRALPGVRDVLSISSAVDVRIVDDELEVAPFVEEVPRSPEALEALRQRVRAHPLYGSSLVAEDGSATALLIHLADVSHRDYLDSRLGERALALAREEAGDAEVWITGAPHVRAQLAELLLGEALSLSLWIGLALAGVLLLVFRNLLGVLLPLGTISVALAWTLGVVVLTGHELNAVTTLIPPLLTALGLSYSVHVVSEVVREADERPDADRRTQVGAALQRVALPVVLTGVTTAAGLASLALSPLVAVREFGLFAVVGVLAMLVSSLTLTPAAMVFVRPPRPEASRLGEAAGRRFDAWAARLARFDLARRGPIFAVAALLFVLAIVGATRLRIGTQQVEQFDRDAPVRVHFEAVNERLEGANPILVVIESDAPQAFKEPANLEIVAGFQSWLRSLPEVGGASSLVDYLSVIHRGLLGPEVPTIPDSRRAVSQLFLVGAGDELGRFVDRRFQTTAIHLRTRVVDSDAVVALTRKIEEGFAALPGHLEGTVTGTSVVLAGTFDAIMRGQALSVVAALGIIYLILAAMFVSLRTGALALVPNVMPVAAFFGALGWSGVRLDTATSLVAPMVLGIAVDDTIHYFASFLREARQRGDEKSATVAALRQVGRPVTVTTAALCAAFLMLNLSELRSNGQMGMLAAFALAFAWATDMVLTPALCSGLRVVTLWDLLTLDLGAQPQRRVSIFVGLRAAQARIVALLGSLLDVPGGQRLYHAGEPGEALYVVVEGRLRASLPGADEALEIAHYERGDVFGEVGVFHGERPTHVDVLEDARLLRLTEQEIAELGQRYPRIASVVYRNLNWILAARLHKTTQRLHAAAEAGAASAELRERESALERAFFRGGTDRYREALHRVEATDPAGALLAAAGLADESLGERLAALDLHPETLAALALVPLVEVAWADDHVDAREREALLAGARASGFGEGNPGFGLLRAWLETRPPPALFEAWRATAEAVAHELSVESRLRLGRELAGRAREVAEAAGGFLGVAAVSRHEELLLAEIAAVFSPDLPDRSRARETSDTLGAP